MLTPPFMKSKTFLWLHFGRWRNHRTVEAENTVVDADVDSVFTETTVTVLVPISIIHVDRVERRLGVAKVWIVEFIDLRRCGGVVDGHITVSWKSPGWEA